MKKRKKSKYFGFIDKRPKILFHYLLLAVVVVGILLLENFLSYLASPLGYLYDWSFDFNTEVINIAFWYFVLLIWDSIIHTYIIKED